MNLIPVDITGQEPILLDEAKNFCYVTGNHWDDLISDLISEVREIAEDYTGQILISGSYKIHLDSFPPKVIVLPYYPVKEISSIEYVDSDGVTQTVDSDDYITGLESYNSRILGNWPIAKDQPEAVTINFTAGYDNSSPRLTMPKKIRKAMRALIKDGFDIRNEIMVSEGSSLNVERIREMATQVLSQESLKTFV